MDHNYTRSGNVIAKDAIIQGAHFVINKGTCYIGHHAEVHGERNNEKPIISWGKYFILSDRSKLVPAEISGTSEPFKIVNDSNAIVKVDESLRTSIKYNPIRIGHHVYIGEDSIVSAGQIGNYVSIGGNCQIGKQAVVKDCVVIPDNVIVPDYAVVGPNLKYVGRKYAELPESAQEEIEWFCEMCYRGIQARTPFADLNTYIYK